MATEKAQEGVGPLLVRSAPTDLLLRRVRPESGLQSLELARPCLAPPRPDFQDGDIVVTAIDLVEGLIATCPGDNQTIPPPPPIPVGEEGAADAQLARDGTLRWRWEHRADGTKYVTAQYFYLGEWLTAIEESLTSPLE